MLAHQRCGGQCRIQPRRQRRGVLAGAVGAGGLEVAPAPPDRVSGVEGGVGLAGEVLGWFVPSGLDVADVGRVEPHLHRQRFLAQAGVLAPVGDFGGERLGRLLGGLELRCFQDFSSPRACVS